MNIIYSKKTCILRMLRFVIITFLGLLLVITPCIIYFTSSAVESDAGWATRVTSVLTPLVLLIALWIEDRKGEMGLWNLSGKLHLKYIFLSLLLGLGWQVLYYFMNGAQPLAPKESSNLLMQSFLFVGIMVLAPVAEELLFRKWLITMMNRANFSKYAIVLTSAVLFFLCHSVETVPRFDTLIVSIPLCLLYFKTNDVRYAIIAHTVNNLIAFILF